MTGVEGHQSKQWQQSDRIRHQYGKAEQGVSCRFVRGCLGMPLTVEDGGVSEDMPGMAEDLVI